MRLCKIIIAALAVILVFNLACVVFQFGSDQFKATVSDILPLICAILAIIGLAAAFGSFKVYDKAKVAWLLLLIGIAAFAAAETLYGVEELILKLKMDEFTPSPADGFWILGYLPFLAGLILFIYAYLQGGLSFGKWKPVLIPAAVAFIAGIALMAYFVFMPIASDAETKGIAKFVYFYYPLGDLAMLAPAIVLVYLASQFGKGKFSVPWKLIAIGLLCFSVSDIAYAILDWQGLYTGGGVTDVGWNLAYLLIALGGAKQRELIASVGKGGAK